MSAKKRVPNVIIPRPSNLPIQLRYTDPESKKEIRISTNTRDEAEALEEKSKLEAKLLLAKVKDVLGETADTSWQYLLRGLWESGLRIDELMQLHWKDGQFIVPHWKRGALPVLAIPASMQQNDTEESIPLLPGFESLLLDTPEAQRFGWVFNPMSLQVKLKRRVRNQRPTAKWVGKVISRVGEKAGVIVQPAKGKGKPKFASAHDLRRSCGERLALAGVPEREIAKVLRHADVQTTRKFYVPGSVQESAGIIRDRLACT